MRRSGGIGDERLELELDEHVGGEPGNEVGHVCRIARVGTAVFLAGNNGKIGKLVWK